jgi:hypothetical protein
MSLLARHRFDPDSAIPIAPRSGVYLRASQSAHFFERLTRLDERQVDLALWLYDNPEVVDAMFVSPTVPGYAARIAVSLDHPTKGPFVVISRDGDFVTCLARGMTARHATIISRCTLEQHIAARGASPNQ